MNDETLKRRAEIIEAIYRHGMMPTWELAEHLDVTPEDLTANVAALVEQGALTPPGASGTCYVTDATLGAMDRGVRAAAEAIVSNGAPAWSPHLTLADCAAWAEAIVVALETSDDWILEEVYEDALCLWRALARGASATGRLLDSQRRLAREAAHADRYDIARAYSAILAVRMLAAQAAGRGV